MNIKMIAFDADDTLWHGEVHYQETLENLKQILSAWDDPQSIEEIMYEIEMRNLPLYGYGVKAFMLSMIEAAVKITDGEISGKTIAEILSMGRSMLETDVVLYPDVKDTLEQLSGTFPLMVITKGDLLDQNAKVERSGLQKYFSQVEVVNDKTPDSYRSVLEKYHIDPKSMLMVGNSIRSDIVPILALGGIAVHIPANTTWEHEMVPGFDTSQDNFYEIEHFGQLPSLIQRIIRSKS
jgi:putative hydrolase of the HAD superfamily